MNDNQLLRYSRQIMLPTLGISGQQDLLDSHVLIIGLGGLGSPVALYLAAAGVGQISLVDDDSVDITNLQRQIIHQESDIGRSKVTSAANSMRALNSEIVINTQSQRLDTAALKKAVQQADVVVDASDNFATRFAINQACVENHTPLVSGAAIRLEGQVSVFPNNPASSDAPCYRCLYEDGPEEAASCSDSGVLAPLVGIIGSIQATETIKLLSGLGTTLAGRLLTLDASTLEFREIRLRRDPACPICSGK
jgi:molybdopterin-synthase adenylyltransferase